MPKSPDRGRTRPPGAAREPDARSERAARVARPGPSRGGDAGARDAAGGPTLPSKGDPRDALAAPAAGPPPCAGAPQPERRDAAARAPAALNLHLLDARARHSDEGARSPAVDNPRLSAPRRSGAIGDLSEPLLHFGFEFEK